MPNNEGRVLYEKVSFIRPTHIVFLKKKNTKQHNKTQDLGHTNPFFALKSSQRYFQLGKYSYFGGQEGKHTKSKDLPSATVQTTSKPRSKIKWFWMYIWGAPSPANITSLVLLELLALHRDSWKCLKWVFAGHIQIMKVLWCHPTNEYIGCCC